jgi:hypothetical protein
VRAGDSFIKTRSLTAQLFHRPKARRQVVPWQANDEALLVLREGVAEAGDFCRVWAVLIGQVRLVFLT